MFSWQFPAESSAAGAPWVVRELAISTEPGDQIAPDLDGESVVFLDRGTLGSDRVLKRHIGGGLTEELLSGGALWAGPSAADGGVAWQTSAGDGCLRSEGMPDRCITAPQASALALSGSKAVINDSGSTIRLLDFDTMRSRMLDSYTTPDMRYDPDIDGNTAVWIRERGYAGKYYEPLITSYDLVSGVSAYLTKTGGGAASDGDSRYLRRHPVISNGKVCYQQKINEAGEQWDIFGTDPATYGVPIVQAAGDQVNPSLSSDLLIYQDNRSGHNDDAGHWVDDWNIYLKDLTTNIEQPLCIAAGDQVNPVIKGNLVVWQDNRNGNWDIYAAELSAPVEPPDLTLSVDSSFWGSYQDYTSGNLTVDYAMTNYGAGPAVDASIARISTSPPDVIWAGMSPASIPLIDPGGAADVEMRYRVPSGVVRFWTTMYANCKDGAGSLMWFPASPPDQ